MPTKKKKITLPKKKFHITLFDHNSIKASLTVLCIFATYLIILPLATARIVPCLTNHPFVSYTSKECTVERGLDTFMGLAITGISLLTMVFVVFMKRYLKIAPFRNYQEWKKIPPTTMLIREFTPVVITAILMGLLTVTTYLLWFLPSVEHAVRNAPILLDSMK